MHRLAALLALALPAPALAQTVPPLCRVVQECFGTTCAPHNEGAAMALALEGNTLVLNDAARPRDPIRLTAVPGEGTQSWVGRALRTRGTMLLSLGTQNRAALSVHNDEEGDLTLTLHLDCTEAPPPLTK